MDKCLCGQRGVATLCQVCLDAMEAVVKAKNVLVLEKWSGTRAADRYNLLLAEGYLTEDDA